MATTADLLADAVDRIREHVGEAVDGLSEDELAIRVDGRANSIAWLVWHQARVADSHIADAADEEELWSSEGWMDRFDLALDRADTGYGHSAEQAAVVRASAELLRGYAEAVADRTTRYVEGLSDADLDRVVDEHWDPPVTLGVRLVSVLDDCIQHLGQAALVRGLVAG